MKFVCKMLPAALLLGATAAAGFVSGPVETGAALVRARLCAAARDEAAARGDDRAWIAETALLALAELRAGRPEQAEKALSELNGRFSVREFGDGTLASDDRIAEAIRTLRRIADLSGADAKLRFEAQLAQVNLLLRFGGVRDVAEIIEMLKKLEQDGAFATEARLRRICVLLRSGRAAEALRLAEGINAEGDAATQLELLKLLAMLRTGAADDFDAEWKKARAEILPRPDKLAFDILALAAENAMGKSDRHPERAAFYWNDAYGFAANDELRRYALRKRFDCCAEFDAHEAAAVAKRYVEVFPEISGAERAEILVTAGRLLVEAKLRPDPQAALEFFKLVADDGKAPPEDRRAAARDAAITAEKLGLHDEAKRYFELLISKTGDPVQLQSAQLLLAEYLIRRRDYAGAEQILRNSSGWAEKERAGRLLIQALAAQEKYRDALVRAEALRNNSADPDSIGFGAFHAALMEEKLGRLAEARDFYLKYAEKYAKSSPPGEFVRAARFSAAKLALDTGDYAAAGGEFLDYVRDYPDDRDARSAMFWALRAGCLDGDRQLAESALAALERAAGQGDEYFVASLQLIDLLRITGAAKEGLERLDKLDRTKCKSSDVAAMLDLMRAKLLLADGRRAEALEAAEKLLAVYPPGTRAAADAAFMAGNLYMDNDMPDKALPLLLRAHDLRPASTFAEAVSARLAECRLELYNRKKDVKPDDEDLLAAAKIFGELASSAAAPEVRLRCKYRLGWCLERRNDPQAAYEAYVDTLRYAKKLKDEERSFDRKLCSLGAYAALNLLLNRQQPWPDADQKGAAVIRLVKSLALPGGDAEFEAVRKEFNKRYLNR